MFHLAAFTYQPTNTGAGVYITVPAVVDAYLTRNANNRYIVPDPMAGRPNLNKLAAGYAQGVEMTVARVYNSKLRDINLPNITPVVAAAAVPTSVKIAPWLDNGPDIPVTDEFGVIADSAGTGQQTAALWLHDGVMNAPKFGVRTIIGTSTITTVANTWVTGTITLTDALPPGRYEVIGMDIVGTTCIFGRLVFSTGTARPGCLGRASLAVLPEATFRMGNFGSFGSFVQYSQPQLEVFASSSASIVFTVYLDVVKIG